MTSASTLTSRSSPAPDEVPLRLAHSSSAPGAGSVPPRRPARFPRAAPSRPDGPDSAPVVHWAGTDGTLAELVRDHATAAGITVTEDPGAAPVLAALIDGEALEGSGGEQPPGSALVVIAPDGPLEVATWQSALAHGALALVQLPSQSERLLSLLAELARPRRAALTIGVAGGCGGAGASSFAARLAAAGRARADVTLIDADPLGGGLDLLVEEMTTSWIGWADAAALGPDDGEALRDGLPVVDEVRLLVAGTHPGPDGAALTRALGALTSLGGIVIVDLSPALVPAALPYLDALTVVVPGTDHAVRATARRLRSWQVPVSLPRLVVRRRGPLHPSDVAEDLELPLAGSFRDSPSSVVPLLDVRRGGADRTCRQLLGDLLDEVPA